MANTKDPVEIALYLHYLFMHCYPIIQYFYDNGIKDELDLHLMWLGFSVTFFFFD